MQNVEAEAQSPLSPTPTDKLMAQDPIRARKADRWDALVNSGIDPDEATKRVEQEFASTSAQSTLPAPSRRTETTVGEDIAGMARQFANKAMFGSYPKAAGALQSLGSGRSAAEEAQRIQQYMNEYENVSPTLAGTAKIAGELAPYLSGGRALISALNTGARKVGLSRAVTASGKAYNAARSAPVIGSVSRVALPSSAKSATEIALLEGTRGAAEAAPEESRIAEALKRASIGQVFGRAGEVVGTYAAGKVGPTLGKIATKAKQSADEIGEKISAWKDGAPVQLTPKMAQLYQKSKLLKEAVDTEAENLGLMANSPVVLARAYSAISRAIRGTPDAADVQREVLQPFLKEIDTAAQGKLSPLIRKYSDAKKSEEAVELGRDVVQYVRTGKGKAGKVSPEAIAAKASKPYTSQAERDALTQSLIASLGEGGKSSGTIAQRLLMPLRGAGTVADLATQLGGTPSFAQQMAQRAGIGFGASRTP